MARRHSNNAVQTALTAAAGAADTTLTVGDTTGWPVPAVGDVGVGSVDYGDSAKVEIFTYTGKTATTLTGCIRGLDGTAAIAHAVNAKVVHVASAHDVAPIPAGYVLLGPATSVTGVDIGAAFLETTTIQNYRQFIDFTNALQVRLVVRVRTAASDAGTSIRAQFSTDGGTSWAYLDGVSGPSVLVTAVGNAKSDWVDLAAAARADVLLRWGFEGGAGSATNDPVVSTLILQARR